MPKRRQVPEHIVRALSENRGYDWTRYGTIEFAGADRLQHIAPPAGTGPFGLGFRCVICLEGRLFRVWGLRLRWKGGELLPGVVPICGTCWESEADAQAGTDQ